MSLGFLCLFFSVSAASSGACGDGPVGSYVRTSVSGRVLCRSVTLSLNGACILEDCMHLNLDAGLPSADG